MGHFCPVVLATRLPGKMGQSAGVIGPVLNLSPPPIPCYSLSMLISLKVVLNRTDANILLRLAKEDHRSRASLLRIIIEQYLRGKGYPAPPPPPPDLTQELTQDQMDALLGEEMRKQGLQPTVVAQ